MGAQGRRNLSFIRKKGRLIAPKLTRRVERNVHKGKKWVDALAGVGRAGTEAMDAFQRTDVPGVFDAVSKGGKAAHKLGKEIIEDKGVRKAGRAVKATLRKATAPLRRKKGGVTKTATGTMQQNAKQQRIPPDALARIVRSAQS